MPPKRPAPQIAKTASLICASYWSAFSWHLLARHSLWRELSRDASHPVATHLRRQLKRARHLPLLKLSLAFGFVLLIAMAYVYLVVDDAIVWLLPLWLMLFSALPCAIWIARIVALMSRQSVFGVLDEISVIPPGRVFIYLTICKVVLNRDDAVVWLGLLRRVLAGLALLVLLMTLCIALTLLAESTLMDFVAILLDLVLATAVIWLEHSQSTVLACLIAIEVANRFGGKIDKTSVAVAVFSLAQILCYGLALTGSLIFENLNLSVALLLFLLIREFLVSALWRLILHDANEVGAAPTAGEWSRSLGVSTHVGGAD